MGHRDSSAALGGAGAFRAAGDGTRLPDSQHRPKNLSWAARVLLMAIRVYQMCFSALMPSACKFYPSCSKYAATAIQLHGARHGSWLALRRLARCHPFTRGGVDLVPDAEENSAASEPGAGHTCSSPESEVHS
jgi:putative membrane protein insertion efficiency factor